MCQLLEQPSTSSTNGQPKQRDEKGRFAPGNSGGPGNPFGRRVAEMRKAMLAAVSLQDIADVFQELLAKAKTGDVQAMKLFLAYTVGKPEKVHDPDRVDVEEWEVHKETAAMTDTLGQVLDRPLPETPLKLAESMRPAMSHIVETAYEKKFLSEPPSPNGAPVEQAASLRDAAVAADTGKLATCPTSSPSPNGFSPAPRAPLPKGSYTDVPPGMAEFYDTLVKRGFAPPIPDDQKRS